MPTLDECMKSIRELVKAKGHEDTFDENTIFKKGVFGVIELSEALDLIKKHGIETLRYDKFLRDSVSVELIDVIFYVLDIYGILNREGVAESPDKVFEKKLAKNMTREYQYGRPELK